jgi:hypothetical protein
MTKVRIIYGNLWRTGTVLAESSQHPQFPSEDTQIDTPLQPWRSRYGTGSGLGLFVVPAAAYGAEKVSNGGFGSDTTGWTPTDCTVASVAGGQAGNCLEITRTGGTSQAAKSSYFSVTAGHAYRLSFYVKSGTSGDTAFYGRCYIGTAVGAVTGNSSGSWVQYSIDFISPATSAVATCDLYKYNATAGTMLFDTVTVKEITAGGFIDFDEGGAELTATLTAGSYTGTSLATEVKTQLDAAGGTYTVDYSETTGKFTIARGAGNFTLRWLAGAHAYLATGTIIGFNVTADDTGAATYTSDYRRIHYPAEYIDLDQGSANQYNFVALINHNISASAVITVYGADDSAFTSNVVSDVVTYNASNVYFFLAAARTKRYIRVHVADPTNTNTYIQIGTVFIGAYWEPGFSFLVDYADGCEDVSDIEASDDLVLYARERTILDTMVLPFRLNESDKATAALFMRTVGLTKAFVVCWNYSAPNANSLLCVNAELSAPVYKAPENWDWSMTVREIA